MVSTGKVKPSPHAEDDPLASLKIESKQINADHEDLALAA